MSMIKELQNEMALLKATIAALTERVSALESEEGPAVTSDPAPAPEAPPATEDLLVAIKQKLRELIDLDHNLAVGTIAAYTNGEEALSAVKAEDYPSLLVALNDTVDVLMQEVA